MCMEKETAAELGSTIGRVEEVETDSSGECIGKFLRMRISVDITKPLEKIIILEHKEMKKEESTKCNNKDDIPMVVYYERLPDFYFSCRRIGQQYMECIYYKSQSKEKLAYDPWLKAITMANRLKQIKGKDSWNSECSQPNTEVPDGTNTKLIPSIGSKKQHDLEEQRREESLNQARTNPGLNKSLPERQPNQGGVEDHLMQGATKLREQEDNYLGKQNQADNSTALRKGAEVGNSEREMNGNWKREIVEHEKKKSMVNSFK